MIGALFGEAQKANIKKLEARAANIDLVRFVGGVVNKDTEYNARQARMALDDALKQLTVDLHREFKRLKETKRMRRSSIFSVQPKSKISVVNLEDFAKNLEIAAQTPINDSPIHEDAQDSEVIINDDAHERDSEDELKSDFGSDHRLRSIILQEAGRQENNEEDVSQNTATSLGKSVLLSQLRELAEVPSDMNESEMH